jgi:hypothetical protein
MRAWSSSAFLGARWIIELAGLPLAKEFKLERIVILPECRTVKDWFPTRESADAVVAEISEHIRTTGETHTCRVHTHTKPPPGAVPVYIGEFSLQTRFLKAKRFCPCPCCWDEFAKFGHGRFAWFPDEQVIRIIGPDCFRALNPEAHERAASDREIERERARLTDFLLSNLGKIADVIKVIERAIVVARAVEQFHELLHDRLRTVRHNLWRHVRRGGELTVAVKRNEFRRGEDGEMHSEEVDAIVPYATLPAFEMLDPANLNLLSALERALGRIRPYAHGDRWKVTIDEMEDSEKRIAAETLSRAVKAAVEAIASIERLRRFTDRVTINTLRGWSEQPGCPAPFNYSHNGDNITFGPSDVRMVGVPIPHDLRNEIGSIDFWTALEPRSRR